MNKDLEGLQAEAKEEENYDDTDSSSYSFPSYTRFTFTGKTKSRLGRHSRLNCQTNAKNEKIVKEDGTKSCSATNEHNAISGGLTVQATQTPNLKWLQGNNTHPVTHPFTPGTGSNTLNEPNFSCENDSGIDISSQSNFLSFLKNDSTCKRNLGFNNTPFRPEEKHPTSLKELNNIFQKTSGPSINFVYKSKDKENNATSEIQEDPWNKFKRICDSSAPQPLKAPSSTLSSFLPRVEKPVEPQNINKVGSVSQVYSSDSNYKKRLEYNSTNIPLDLSTNESLSGNRSIFGKSSGESDCSTSSTASATAIHLSDKPETLARHLQKLNAVSSKEAQTPDTFSSLLPTFLIATNKTNFNEPPQVTLNKSPPYSSNNVSKPLNSFELKSSPPARQNIASKSIPTIIPTVEPNSAERVLEERKYLHRHLNQSNVSQTSSTHESKQHEMIHNNILPGSELNDNMISVKTNHHHHLGISSIKNNSEHYQPRTSLESSSSIKPQIKPCDLASTIPQNNQHESHLSSSNLSAFRELSLKSETLSGESAREHLLVERQNTVLSKPNVHDKPSNIESLVHNNQKPTNLIQPNIPGSSLQNPSSTPPSAVQPTLKTSPETEDKFTDDFNQQAEHVLQHNQKTYLAPAQPPERKVSDDVKLETPASVFSRPTESGPAKRTQNNCFKAPAPRGLMSRANTDLYVNGKVYTILSILGRGGSSEVFQVIDPRSTKLLAVKCVDLSMVDKMIADGYLNEIDLLSKLQGCASVIRMFDYEYVQEQKMLYVVMEKGDIDLSHLIRDITMTKKISMSMIIYYWTEMLNAVKDIHDQGIIHSDLKPANFLLVSGRLKLIDFGIASSQGDMTSVVKEVTTGTWNYMSPEALMNTSATGKGFKITYKSDVWSLGCILYNLVYGKTPFAHITNTWAKLQAIVDPHHQIQFPEVGAPPVLTQALRACLQRDPVQRSTVAELLTLPYHSTSHIGLQIHNILSPQSWLQVKHLFPEIVSAQDKKDFDYPK